MDGPDIAQDIRAPEWNYYSTNPDAPRRARRIEVKTTRPGVTLFYRTSYAPASR